MGNLGHGARCSGPTVNRVRAFANAAPCIPAVALDKIKPKSPLTLTQHALIAIKLIVTTRRVCGKDSGSKFTAVTSVGRAQSQASLRAAVRL